MCLQLKVFLELKVLRQAAANNMDLCESLTKSFCLGGNEKTDLLLHSLNVFLSFSQMK